MNTVRELLRDADPLLRESPEPPGSRDRLRQAVVAAASAATIPSSERFRAPFAIATAVALTAIALTMAAIVAVGSRSSSGFATLQAAVRFEVRLAEDRPAPGLSEVRSGGSDRSIYLHQEIVVTNDDIAQCSLVPGSGPSRFGIRVQFNATGTRKMRQATAGHVGRPVAILIDGVVVMAPVLRSPIDASAEVTGDFTQAEAERIVNGIGLR